MLEEKPAKVPLVARMYFIWGQSCAYWGNQVMSKRLHAWAVNSWTRALFHAPDWPKPLLRRAVIRGRELDDYTGAVQDLSMLVKSHPEWAEPYLQRGILHSFHALQSAPQAVTDLQSFLRLAPQEHTWRLDAERLIERLNLQLAERL